MNAAAWTCLLLPLASTALITLGGNRISRRVAAYTSTLTTMGAFAAAVVAFVQLLGRSPEHRVALTTSWTWLSAGQYHFGLTLLTDQLSIVMMLIVAGVGSLIVAYSVGYMDGEDEERRYFAYISLFVFSMLLFVQRGNLFLLLAGWGMVGLSSYLLIGFHQDRPSAIAAAKKAFVMNAFGDATMVLALFLLIQHTGKLGYADVFAASPHGGTVANLIALGLLGGAVAKSAQLPLHTWLPDAMEGPTPVSALIHAATMVTAGVYLIGRMHPIYDIATYAHNTVAIIGAVTALFAATIAIVQTDIKRVLAYSTMSQIGYMFLAVGIGAYAAGFFHLLAHAFFKALLFMAAGNVIHAMHDEQDMRKYGGLFRQLPRTSWSFLIGSLSLVGVIPFIGFFSKEQILGAAFSKPDDTLSLIVWGIGFITALITGFYTDRMWWMAFGGKPSPQRPVEHPHEAPPVMLVPVMVLAVLATVGGVIQTRALGFRPQAAPDVLDTLVGKQAWEGGAADVVLTAITMILATLLFLAAYRFYVARTWKPWSARFPRLQNLLERKYYFDEIYNFAFVRSMDALAELGLRDIEQPLIDGVVVATGDATEVSAGGLSLTQSGYFRNYVLVFLAGACIAAILILIRAGS